MTPFIHNGKVLRLVYSGITLVRLQDNTGKNYLMTHRRLVQIMPMRNDCALIAQVAIDFGNKN